MTTRGWRLFRQQQGPLRAGRDLTKTNLLVGQTFKNLSRMTPRKHLPTPLRRWQIQVLTARAVKT